MSRSYEHGEENFEKRKPDYVGVESRDMRSVDDKGYTGETLDDEAQDEEEVGDQWSSENQSPIAGKMFWFHGGTGTSSGFRSYDQR